MSTSFHFCSHENGKCGTPPWKKKFETQRCAVLSNDKPPQPWASGRPQVHFGAKLQQIGRTVWCRPFGTDSGLLPPAGWSSMTSSLTVLIYTKQKKMCPQKPIPPPAVAQSYLLVMFTMSMIWILNAFFMIYSFLNTKKKKDSERWMVKCWIQSVATVLVHL